MVPISATVKPPAIAIIPPKIQAINPNPGDPAAPYTAVGLKNIPAPITVPTTTVKAVKLLTSFFYTIISLKKRIKPFHSGKRI